MATGDLPQGWTWDGVLSRLEEHVDFEASAREHGAIVRRRVVKTAAQLLRLVLAYCLSGFSLRTTAAWAEASGEASLSDVALLKRLRRCGPWLSALAGQLSAAVHPEAAWGEDGRRVVAVDATAICSPGGKHKRYRLLHTVYDVGAQHFRTTEFSERQQAERLDVGTVEAGEIRLGDRAYGRYRDLAAVKAAGADYVVRLSARALLLAHPDGTALKRAPWCKTAEREGRQDVPVVVNDANGGTALTARLIILPLPPDKAEEARRHMRKKSRAWGYTPSEDALATAGCLMLITSLDAEHWPAERVLGLYRRRWQVELAFKRLKSLLELETLRAFESELVYAWIHAVILVALLIEIERPPVQSGAPDSPRWDNANARSPCGGSSTSLLAV